MLDVPCNYQLKMVVSDIGLDRNRSKILAIFVLGVGSVILGLIPSCISARNRRRYPLVTSTLLCFGAGVILATALVHILPEVQSMMKRYSELVFCAGFFLVFAVDELMHVCFGETIQHSHGGGNHLHPHDDNTNGHSHSHRFSAIHEHTADNNEATQPGIYGSTQEATPLVSNKSTPSDECETPSATCPVPVREPCDSTIAGTFGLLCALSLHSIFEGLAIGIQDSGSKVLVLTGAVACHKFVVAFCLGVELCATRCTTKLIQLAAITVFAMGSVLGIIIGIVIVDMSNGWMEQTIPILQAIAGGTLLYVTMCEVLPRERTRFHWNRRYRFAGIAQFMSVVVGFVVMTVINYTFEE